MMLKIMDIFVIFALMLYIILGKFKAYQSVVCPLTQIFILRIQ